MINRLAKICLTAIVPLVCASCKGLYRLDRAAGEPSASQTDMPLTFNREMAPHLCRACRKEFQAIQSPLCPRCGNAFTSPHGPDHECEGCRRHPFKFASARSVGRYEGVLPTVIHQLKFNGRDQLAGPLGRLMWFTLLNNWQPAEFDHVLPVPLHPRRLRQRGFNQARLLIRHWPSLAAGQAIPLPRDWLDDSVLLRRRHTRPQTGLKGVQRAVNLKGAFVVNPHKDIRSKRLLLVDDVLTTGTTADACTAALLQAGAASVHVLTLGRTGP